MDNDLLSASDKISASVVSFLQQQTAPMKASPPELPPDIQRFLDDYKRTVLRHKTDQIAAFYADDYLHYGTTKSERVKSWRRYIYRMAFLDFVVTRCTWTDRMAVLEGWAMINHRRHMKWPILLIKENGQWRWYGNRQARHTFFQPNLLKYLRRN